MIHHHLILIKKYLFYLKFWNKINPHKIYNNNSFYHKNDIILTIRILLVSYFFSNKRLVWLISTEFDVNFRDSELWVLKSKSGCCYLDNQIHYPYRRNKMYWSIMLLHNYIILYFQLQSITLKKFCCLFKVW